MKSAPQSPEIMTMAEVAARLGISEPTARRAVRQESDDNRPDELRMIPGGRCIGERYLAFRAIFEEILAAKHLTQPTVADVSPVKQFLHRVA